nr:GntR family transcriptional regulator [uncultured Sphingomonas sp.]
MNAAPVFDRVYAALKLALRAGRFAPGTRLDPARLAAQLAASITPVRDTLHRLTGERMVRAVHDGFQVPSPTEPDLVDLYQWHHQLLTLALADMPPAWTLRGREDRDHADAAAAAASLFGTIGDAVSNRELVSAVAGAGDRLHSARIAETSVLGGLEEELAAMAGLDPGRLPALLERYRDRRVAAAASILRALYRGGA